MTSTIHLRKPRAKKQPESIILKAVRQYLEVGGWFVVRIQQGMGCHRGIADLCAMKDSRTVWVEIKTPSGVLSDFQQLFADNVLRAGGEYLVARSSQDVDCLVDCLGADRDPR